MWNNILSKFKFSKDKSPKDKIYNNKLSYLIRIIVVVVVAVGLVFAYKAINKPPIIPEEVLDQSLKSTLAAEKFRFKLQYKTKNEAKEELWSKIKGEQVGKEQMHIMGEMLKTPIEIFQIKDKTYIKNSVGSWTILDENDVHQQELLVNEVNPLAIFAFKEIPKVKYLGTKEIKGQKYYVIEYVPNISNQFLEVMATDFVFKSWINTKTGLITKTSVTAKSKGQGKGNLLIDLELYDYGKEIKIDPPVKK